MDILVYADWKELEKPAPMGRLSVIHTRGHAVFSFSYDKQWIKEDNAQNLFLDSSPDRWGRVLMDRREAIIAKKENRKIKTLYEEDYLLGVASRRRVFYTKHYRP